jgi:hypothetical protein
VPVVVDVRLQRNALAAKAVVNLQPELRHAAIMGGPSIARVVLEQLAQLGGPSIALV